MKFFRRRLPHWDVPGVPTFVTWRLAGSLPAGCTFTLGPGLSRPGFLSLEQHLHRSRPGPFLLARPELAVLVRDSILDAADAGLCSVDAYVVMPNHVHVLWTPTGSLMRVVQHVKWISALQVNRALGRSGVPVWHGGYFDRLIEERSGVERVRRYIEWNPVKGGLVRAPEEFPWSSGYRGVRGRG